MPKPFHLFLLVFLTAAISGLAQERPKIGLVLSGGGAKGMAHIGVLKELERHGIRPDYITGTSMGSIVGGLYAIGYSADEIEEIALGMDWDALLSNQVSLDQITYLEKEYYQRYLIELGINKTSLELPKGLIEGQKLSELLTALTRHVHHIQDFDDFPVPFACVGTDLVTGEPVVMRSGSLATALRASMAIPSVFTPVDRDGHYMVDGGLVRNFPVQECIDMGADIIIGVFVSDDLLPKEQLASAVDVLTQSAFVMSVFDSREQKKKCDLLIEPDLVPYTTFSFEAGPQIIQRGEQAGEAHRPGLMALADSLNFTPGVSIERPALRDTFRISEVNVIHNENIPERFIQGNLTLDKDSRISLKGIENRIEALYGTRYFDKVTYTLNPMDDDSYELLIDTDEAVPRQIRAGLHYDSENGAGLNLNLTLRDLFPASRTLVEVDIAEAFRVDANFLKYIWSRQYLALKTGINYRNSDVPIGDGRIQAGVFKNNYLNPYFSLLSTKHRNSLTGIKLQYERSNLRPKVASDELRSIERLNWSSWSFQAGYAYNSLNKQFFPTEGAVYDLSAKYSFDIANELTLSDSTGTFKSTVTPENFLTIHARQHNLLPVSPKLTLGLRNILVMNFIEREGIFEELTPFFNDQVFTGGFRPLLRNSISFWGVDQLSYLTDHLFYSELSVQYEFLPDFYLEGVSQYMNSLYPVKWFYSSIDEDESNFFNDTHSLWGYGFKASYMSLIGPVTAGIASHNKTASWNPFFSIGFYF